MGHILPNYRAGQAFARCDLVVFLQPVHESDDSIPLIIGGRVAQGLDEHIFNSCLEGLVLTDNELLAPKPGLTGQERIVQECQSLGRYVGAIPATTRLFLIYSSFSCCQVDAREAVFC